MNRLRRSKKDHDHEDGARTKTIIEERTDDDLLQISADKHRWSITVFAEHKWPDAVVMDTTALTHYLAPGGDCSS